MVKKTSKKGLVQEESDQEFQSDQEIKKTEKIRHGDYVLDYEVKKPKKDDNDFDSKLSKLDKLFELYEKQVLSEKPNEDILEAFVVKITEAIKNL